MGCIVTVAEAIGRNPIGAERDESAERERVCQLDLEYLTATKSTFLMENLILFTLFATRSCFLSLQSIVTMSFSAIDNKAIDTIRVLAVCAYH